MCVALPLSPVKVLVELISALPAQSFRQAAVQDAEFPGTGKGAAASAPAGGAGVLQRSLSKQQAEAAIKVQAAFRGHQARLGVAGMRGAAGVV